jgi:hypothetical protein
MQTSPPLRWPAGDPGGARSPRRPQSVEAPSARCDWRPALAVAAVPRLTGIGPGAREFCGARRPRRWRTCRAACAGWLADRTRSSWLSLGSWGFGNVAGWNSTLEAAVDRSHGRRGRSLVVAAALLGALIGTGLGLTAEDTQTSPTVAAPDPPDAAALAASPPSSQPPASRAAASGDQSDDNPSSSVH